MYVNKNKILGHMAADFCHFVSSCLRPLKHFAMSVLIVEDDGSNSISKQLINNAVVVKYPV
jgi:hypothetical protein